MRNLKKTIALAHSQGASSSTPQEDDLQYEASSEESDDQPSRQEFNALSDAVTEISSTVFNTNQLLESLIRIQFHDNEERIREDYDARRRR